MGVRLEGAGSKENGALEQTAVMRNPSRNRSQLFTYSINQYSFNTAMYV